MHSVKGVTMWGKIKEFFGIETKKDKQKKQEEKENKEKVLESFKDGEKELLGKLDGLSREWVNYDRNRFKKLDDILPKELEIELKEYTGDSEDVINKKVNEKFGLEKQNKQNIANEKFDELIGKVGNQKDSAKLKLEQTLDENLKQQADTLEKIKQRVATRGLARSSIKDSMDTSAKRYFERENNLAESDFGEKIKELDSQLRVLENDKKDALAELDIKFAKQIDDEIKSLTNKRNNEIEKIEKYNAEQKDKALKYKVDRAKKVQAQLQKIAEIRNEEAANEIEYGYKGEKLNNYQKRLDAAVEFYGQVPKEYAREMVKNNPQLKNYLGRMYGKLLSYLG